MTGSLSPIGPLAIVLAAAGLTLAGCQRQEPAPAPKPVEAAPPVVVPPAPPLPPPALGRADILAAIEVAASDYAAGRAAQGQLIAGRRFLIRQPFGCLDRDGEDPADGLANWSWGKTRKTIVLSLKPADWKESALAEAGDWEAVEGFWLSRPWLKDETCPAGQWSQGNEGEAEAPPPVSTPQTVGVAAVFEHGGSRLGRRSGRAYAFTVRGEGDQPPPAPVAGYRLVLEGRLGAFDDGRAIHCRASGPDQRPVCIAAVLLDRVAFEDAGGAVLSEWRGG
ncbi:hypothetical protein [Phenylobacterium sp.]|uniref:hypothetical protein n=1 Tax=Phenylobacterium sp. TaxID=1871053 RepID=UPI0035B3E2AA